MARFLIVFIALMVSLHTTMGGIGKHCFLCYFSAILQKVAAVIKISRFNFKIICFLRISEELYTQPRV
jgi:hypothetical protein